MAKYYAVKIGRKPGIYESWEQCKQQVDKYPKAQYKSFSTVEEAQKYLNMTSAEKNNKETKKEIKKQSPKEIEQPKISISTLTQDQRNAYETMISGQNVFLTGEAGTGKSYVIHAFIQEMQKQYKNVLVCAPTGVAAINVGGVTIHRCFQASIEPQIDKRIERVPEEVKQADIIIIDEISMCRIDLFDYVVRVVAKAEESCLKRKQLIVVGDFFQLPPVTVKQDYEVLSQIYPEYDKGFAFESQNWKDLDLKKIELKNIMRQSDHDFIQALNQIRIGNKEAVSFFNQHASPTLIEKGIVLCSRNDRANKINLNELDKIKTRAKIYKSQIVGDVKDTDKPTLDELRFKVGARVIILINDTEMFQYQNGSLGEIVSMDNQSVEVLLDHNQEIITFTYHEWVIEDYTLGEDIHDGVKYQKLKKRKVGSFIQLPLRLAYAITIHKSQGQTYDKVNLIPDCFDCGQLYVALSRVKSLDGLCLISRMKQEYVICHKKVQEFYQVVDEETKKRQMEIIAHFGKQVLFMDESIQQSYPDELKTLVQQVKKQLNKCH